MLGLLKSLVKSNPLSHGLAKGLQLSEADARLEEMTKAWIAVLFEDGDLAEGYRLYRKNRDFQARLARQQLNANELGCTYLNPEWANCIGHISSLDAYLKIRMLGWQPSRPIILLARPGQIANPFYLRLWEKYVRVVYDPAEIARLEKPCALLEDYLYVHDVRDGCRWFCQANSIVERQWRQEGRGPLLNLDEATIERGRQALAGLGMPRDAWFVGLHVRESTWRVQDKGKYSARDSDIATYLDAIKAITDRGGWVVRCGDPGMVPLPALPQVIDYAHAPTRADWLDIFLASQCGFFIGCQSGISHVPATFGVPTLFVNWLSLGAPPYYHTDLFIPKKMKWTGSDRPLTLAEIMHSRVAILQHAYHFADRGVTIVNNTAEEIHGAVLDMLDLVERGQVPYPKSDLQRRFDAALAGYDVVCNSTVAPAFLLENPGLAGDK